MVSTPGRVPHRDWPWLLGSLVAAASAATGHVTGGSVLAVAVTLSLVPLALSTLGSLPGVVGSVRYRRTLVATAAGLLGLVLALGLSPGPVTAVLAVPWFLAGVGFGSLGYERATDDGSWATGGRPLADATLAAGLLAVPAAGLLLVLDRAGLAVAAASGPVVGLPIPDRTLAVAALAHLLAATLVATGLLGRWIAASDRVGLLATRTYRVGAALVVLGGLAVGVTTWLSPVLQVAAFVPHAVGALVVAGLGVVLPVGRGTHPRWRRIAGRAGVVVGGLATAGLLAFVAARAGDGALTGSPVDLPAFLAGLPPSLVVGPLLSWFLGWRLGTATTD